MVFAPQTHVEEAFGVLFQLKGQPDEYVEFDTAALLRSAFKDRIEGLTRAVQGGIYSPNEARNAEGLPSVEFGDEPRVQQQVVPLSQMAKLLPYCASHVNYYLATKIWASDDKLSWMTKRW